MRQRRIQRTQHERPCSEARTLDEGTEQRTAQNRTFETRVLSTEDLKHFPEVSSNICHFFPITCEAAPPRAIK